ncbi:class I adenylate-forming enzyme family protein [Streptomyces microflavus]|uniref:class I adenylate-forming enzyme family protein n=1 Tax=Streptomyces microflavus TaxID=1919 RepID=UPI00331AE554
MSYRPSAVRLVVDGEPVDPLLLRRAIDDVTRAVAKAGARPGLGVLAPTTSGIAFVAAADACRRTGATLVLQSLYARTSWLPIACEVSEGPSGPRVTPRIASTQDRFPANTAVACFTSGSTGDPRLVLLSEQSQEYQYRVTAERMGTDDTDQLCIPLPLSHAYGFSVLGMARLTGARLWVETTHDALTIMQRLTPNGITTLDGVPGLYSALLSRLERFPERSKAFAGLRFRGCGGEPLPTWIEEGCARWEAPLHNGYGLTEAGPNVALNAPGHFYPGTVGLPLPGTEVMIEESRNELLVRGPGVMSGYFGVSRPQQRSDGWLATGDQAEWRGPALHIVGRLDHRVTIHGETVILADVEALVSNRCSVGEVVVDAIMNRRGTTRLGAMVVSAGETDLASWRAAVRDLLPPALRPRVVVPVEKLPRLTSGKLDRGAVRSVLSEHAAAVQGVAAQGARHDD